VNRPTFVIQLQTAIPPARGGYRDRLAMSASARLVEVPFHPGRTCEMSRDKPHVST